MGGGPHSLSSAAILNRLSTKWTTIFENFTLTTLELKTLAQFVKRAGINTISYGVLGAEKTVLVRI